MPGGPTARPGPVGSTSHDVHRSEVVRAAATPSIRTPPGMPNLDISNITNIDSSMDLNQIDTRNVNEVSYVSRQRMRMADFDPDAVDQEGLPLVYNEERIAEFWKKRPGELASRWTRFAGISLPWLTSLGNSFIRGTIERDQGRLAREAVANLEQLGTSYPLNACMTQWQQLHAHTTI